LLVTRKSLIAPNLESPSPVPFPYGREDGLDESANKKAGAGRAPALAGIKSRRWKGAGWAQGIFPAALGGERIAR